MNLAWELDFKYINLDIDSELMINWLITTCEVLAPAIAILIFDYRILLAQEWTIHPHQVYHSGMVDGPARW